jgi:superfamily II helicase
MNRIKLFLIDEVHVLGESSRGAIIEAVVSRMKTISNQNKAACADEEQMLRFVAVSATLPNIDDVSEKKRCFYFKFPISKKKILNSLPVGFQLVTTRRPSFISKITAELVEAIFGSHI